MAAQEEDASIWGFNTTIDKKAQEAAKKAGVPVAIYDVLDNLVLDLYEARVEVVERELHQYQEIADLDEER